MNKKEIYYKFIFPTYDNLSGLDSDPRPTSDGANQINEVRALCRACPERVITYDRLSQTLKNYVDKYLEIPKYFNLRNYWDSYPCQEGGMSLMVSHTPEVGGDFGGFTKFKASDNKIIYCSLMVSSGDFFYSWCLPEEVIVKSKLRDEVVRGRFHSNWYFNNDERVVYNNNNYGVVKKLRTDYPELYHGSGNDKVEYTAEEYINAGYPEGRGYPSAMNPHFGQEKRIFVQHYFAYPGFHYVYQATPKSYINFRDTSNNIYQTSDVYYRDSNGHIYHQVNYFDESGAVIPDVSNVSYTTENIINTDNAQDTIKNVQKIPANGNCGYFTESDNTPVTRYKYPYKDKAVHTREDSSHNLHYYIVLTAPLSTGVTELEVMPYFNVEEYKELTEDLKRDFIDLEVTRRILHYGDTGYENIQSSSTSNIPIIINPVDISFNNGHPSQDLSSFLTKTKGDPDYLSPLHPDRSSNNTVLSYEPPQEYIDRPPLQIPYNLLRYTLNDRPPFSDCETVLIMWVANSDPLAKAQDGITDVIPDGDIAKLHNLNWQQYAIPVSIRCCFKDDSCNTSRFLVVYPHGKTSVVDDEYMFHFRCAEKYKKNYFKEAMYLQDLIKYSNDYIITYQHKYYYNNGFDIQKYLFNEVQSAFKELYVKKAYVSGSYNRENQIYYIKVDNQSGNVYHIDTNLNICFAKGESGSDIFVPSEVLTRDKYSKWDFDDTYYGINNDWYINDDQFIALFDAQYKNNGSRVFTEVSGLLTLERSSDLRSFLRTIYSTDSFTWNDIYISSLGISPTNQVNNDSLKLSGKPTGNIILLTLGVLDGYINIGGTTYGCTKNQKIVVGFKNVFDYTYDGYHHFHYNSSTNQYELDDSTREYTVYIVNYPQIL